MTSLRRKMFSLLAGALFAAVLICFYAFHSAPTTAQNIVTDEGTISGQVLDENQKPVSDVMISADLANVAVSSPPTTSTNKSGEFEITGLRPGIYTLHSRKEDDGYPRSEFNFYDAADSSDPQVQVYPGMTSAGVTVRLGARAALVVGRIVDGATNQPVKHADIMFRRADQPDRFLRTGLSLPVENGEFKLLVPAFPFTVEVTESGYEDWFYKVQGEKQAASPLSLPPGSTKTLFVSLQRRPKAGSRK